MDPRRDPSPPGAAQEGEEEIVSATSDACTTDGRDALRRIRLALAQQLVDAYWSQASDEVKRQAAVIWWELSLAECRATATNSMRFIA